jgi:photosystem II stability/assembly factor-like uncharacterized protein
VDGAEDVVLHAVWGTGSLVVAVGGRYTQHPPSGVILRSTDGGVTWQDVTTSATGPVLAVWGKGSTVVALTIGAPGQVLRSTNGGASWDVVEGVEGVVDLCDFACDLAGRGSTLVAVGEGSVGSTILVSNDLGRTWDSESSPLEHALRAVAMIDRRTVVVGGTGAILRGQR